MPLSKAEAAQQRAQKDRDMAQAIIDRLCEEIDYYIYSEYNSITFDKDEALYAKVGAYSYEFNPYKQLKSDLVFEHLNKLYEPCQIVLRREFIEKPKGFYRGLSFERSKLILHIEDLEHSNK